LTTTTSTPEPTLDAAELTRLVDRGTDVVLAAFAGYMAKFRALSRAAKGWFEQRQWHEAQAGALERLELYGAAVRGARADLRVALERHGGHPEVWAGMKALFARRVADRVDEELAETFFNSVTRAVLTTMGVDARIEFVWFDIEILPSGDELPTYRAFHRLHDTREVVEAVLEAFTFSVPWADLAADAREVARRVDTFLTVQWTYGAFDAIEVAEPVFFRNKGAYLVGRIRRGIRVVPFVLALVSEEAGVKVDAVLMEEDAVSMVFSFARSYFFVDPIRPVELIGFLRSIMPLKPVAELYIALGFVKHGKTVRYRHLYRHLAHSTDRFVEARGTKGMVMICFTLPSYDLVFKVIRDQFAAPKKTTRKLVQESYDLVFKHDRVGRLIDAQEFEHLRFAKDRFEAEILRELRDEARNLVTVTDTEVIIHHCYTERRLNPLNIYVNEVSREKALAAVEEYGAAIKDLASANVFPGDLLIKNFGVTRHGRVVFYDYDELCLLGACRFRKLPTQHDTYGGSEGEVSFFVDDNDIFPEEFKSFLWPAGPLRDHFERSHPDLFTVEFWRRMQAQNAQGVIGDVFPYPHEMRLTRR
jgi:isocitrate dehydrogenase kinase/phosphatase